MRTVPRELRSLWEALPEGALMHDQNAYLNIRASRQPASDNLRGRKRQRRIEERIQIAGICWIATRLRLLRGE